MLAALALLLVIACYCDVRWRLIPNWLTLSILLLGWGQCLLTAPSFLPINLLLTLAFLLVGLGIFALAWLGAGDIKLIVALSSWIQWQQALSFIVIFTLLGGVLAFIVIIYNRLCCYLGSTPIQDLPYGLAISSSAFWLLLIS